MHKIIKFMCINWRLWVMVLPPIVIWFLIFPFRSVPISNSCGFLDPPISYSDIDKPGIKTFIANTVHIPLNLYLYNLRFEYNVRSSRGWLMTTPMTLLIRFNSSSSLIPLNGLVHIPNDSIPDMGVDTSRTYKIPVGSDIVFYYSGDKLISCTASASGGKFKRDPTVSDKDVSDLALGLGTEPGLVKITAETNKWSWVTILCVLYLLWFATVLLVRQSWRFIMLKE